MSMMPAPATRLRRTRSAGVLDVPGPRPLLRQSPPPAVRARPESLDELLKTPATPRSRSLLALSPSRRRTVRALRALSLIGLAAYAAHSLTGLGGSGLGGFFENYLFNILLFAGAALCLLRAWLSAAERGAWSALGIGLLCWVAGEAIFTIDPSQVTSAPFPS